MEIARRKAGFGKDLLDGLDQTVGVQLPPRHIDGDKQRLAGDIRRPSHGLMNRLADCPSTHGNDLTQRFGKRNELGWRNQAALGVLPPHERLEPGHLVGGEMHDRLVVQMELLPRQSPPKVSLHRKLPAGIRARACAVRTPGSGLGRPPWRAPWPDSRPKSRFPPAHSPDRRSRHRCSRSG